MDGRMERRLQRVSGELLFEKKKRGGGKAGGEGNRSDPCMFAHCLERENKAKHTYMHAYSSPCLKTIKLTFYGFLKFLVSIRAFVECPSQEPIFTYNEA